MPEKIEQLESRIVDLESRVKALEIKPEPKAAREVTPPLPKTPEQMMKAELEELEADPEDRIQAKMDRGLTREKAEAAISKRKEFLRAELGLTPKRPSAARRAAGAAAALIIGLLMAVFALAPRASADQQGFPQQFVYNTNFPVIVNAGATSNLLSPLGVANYSLTNMVTIHRGAGIGLAWTFNGNSTFGTQAAGLIVAPSIDGINIDSWQQWNLVGRGMGITNVTVTTNWNANQLAGYKALFLLAITNLGTGVLTNGGTLTTTNSGAGGYTTNVPVATWNVPQGGP